MNKLLSSSHGGQDLIQWLALQMPNWPQSVWKGHLKGMCSMQGPLVQTWLLGLRFLLCHRGLGPCVSFSDTFVLKFVEIPLNHFRFAYCLEETKHSNIYKLPSNGTCHVCNDLVLISNLVRIWDTSFIPFWHEYSDSCSMLCFELVLKDNKLSLHKIVTHCPTAPLHCHFYVQLLDLCF